MVAIRNLFVLVGLVFLLVAGCTTPSSNPYVPSPQPSPSGQNAPATGRTVFILTDAAANMDAVTSIKVTVDRVSAHSSTEGWVIVSSTPKTYDLLELNAQQKQVVLADAQLQPATYEQVRLDISHVVVTDAQGDHEAKLPSGELKVVGEFDVQENTTSSVTFDFVANDSLHATGNGEYILAPVVRLETREDAEIESKGNEEVEVHGGRIRTQTEVGMDANGYVGVGVRIPANANISIGSGGTIHVGPPSVRGNGHLVVGITDRAVNLSDVTHVFVTVESVEVQSASDAWVTVSSTPKTYDLLELKTDGSTALLADAEIDEGTYQQIRLNISHVVVTDAAGAHEAKLPSEELKIVGRVIVGANSTTAATFDFIADQSLHVTGNGEYILAPVVHVETEEDAETETQEDERLEIHGGRSNDLGTFGMDAHGQMGVGLKIDPDARLTIHGESIVEEENDTEESEGTSAEANASVEVEVQ